MQNIIPHYTKATPEIESFLKDHAKMVKIKPALNLILESSYHRMGLAGASANMFTREAVLLQLNKVLDDLQPHYGIKLFDTFRSIKTCFALFDMVKKEVKEAHPQFNEDEIIIEARKFCADPTTKGHFEIPPHNSGGAVDLTLFDLTTGQELDFGTGFDDFTEIAFTNHFDSKFKPTKGFNEERWFEVRKNRRLLFHVMTKHGFINFENEWWHFDLGDCLWAEKTHSNWFYPSAEADVALLSCGLGQAKA